MSKKFTRGRPLVLREGPPQSLKVEVFGTGLRAIFGYHPGTIFVVSCVLDDEHARDLYDWLRTNGFNKRPPRRRTKDGAPKPGVPGKKCYRRRVCGSVPCECLSE